MMKMDGPKFNAHLIEIRLAHCYYMNYHISYLLEDMGRQGTTSVGAPLGTWE